jgi:NADP-dependent 3-hydroxy acid dehydrogenase YdfG
MSVAVITGAASGIGAGLAREAARRGMHVVLADRDEALLGEVSSELGDKALAVPTDVTDPAACEALAARAYAAFGQVDLFFNNAGILTTGLSWEISAEKWRQMVDVNILGVVNGIRAFVPRMIVAHQPGVIINTASTGGFVPSPFLAPYSATKFAVVALTESLAGELKAVGSKVRAALLAPGPVKTEIFRETPTSASGAFHGMMTEMLDVHGLTPDQFAPLVFDGIARGDFWLVPQPEGLDKPLKARTDMILSRAQPTFYGVD